MSRMGHSVPDDFDLRFSRHPLKAAGQLDHFYLLFLSFMVMIFKGFLRKETLTRRSWKY